MGRQRAARNEGRVSRVEGRREIEIEKMMRGS